jgi:hypothetical protein
MANLRLRMRQVLPSFWEDPEMARLALGQRMVYVALWQVADDAGWLPWAPDDIAWTLRIQVDEFRDAVEVIRALPGDERIELDACQRHARIIHLPDYQRAASSTHRTVRHETEHRRECLSEDVPGPGSRPRGPSADQPQVSHAAATQQPRLGAGARSGSSSGGADGGAAPPTTSPVEANLYTAYTALTGKVCDAAAEQWIDDLVTEFDRSRIRDLMYAWDRTGSLLGWVTNRARGRVAAG